MRGFEPYIRKRKKALSGKGGGGRIEVLEMLFVMG